MFISLIQYFYLKEAKLTLKKAIAFVTDLKNPDIKKSTRKKILERLNGNLVIKDPSSIVSNIEVTRVPKNNFEKYLTKVQRDHGIKGKSNQECYQDNYSQ